MSEKQKDPGQFSKKSKKAQKMAKIEQKEREGKINSKKQFSTLVGLKRIVSRQLSDQGYTQIKNKKVPQYLQLLINQHPKGPINIFAIQKSIPKGISVIEAIKHKLGVYSLPPTVKIEQNNEIGKSQSGKSIMSISLTIL